MNVLNKLQSQLSIFFSQKILFLIILGIVVAVSYYLIGVRDENSEIHTMKVVNTVSGLSFQVPSTWRQIETNSTSSVSFVSSDYIAQDLPSEPNNLTGLSSGVKFSVTTEPKHYYIDKSIPVSENVAKQILKRMEDCSTCIESELVTVSGLPAARVVSTAEMSGGFTHVQLSTHERNIRISLIYTDSYNEHREMFDKILSSFEIN